MFDLIWLSAVWMHVAPGERTRAFRKLVTLLEPGGRLVISVRHGPAPPGRSMYETTASEVERLALDFGLITLRARQHADALGRSEITWTLICLQVPDDATGALPLLRSVILNDPKSSTYKLALLRVIARVADSAAGLAAPADQTWRGISSSPKRQSQSASITSCPRAGGRADPTPDTRLLEVLAAPCAPVPCS